MFVQAKLQISIRSPGLLRDLPMRRLPGGGLRNSAASFRLRSSPPPVPLMQNPPL
jgi:hypothetical protein